MDSCNFNETIKTKTALGTKTKREKRDWRLKDIEKLKLLAQEHLGIKEIAKKMGRSMCSINNALDRFNARQPRISHAKPQGSPKRHYTIDKSRPQALWTLPRIAKLSSVIYWLQQKKFCIIPTHFTQSTSLGHRLFYINNHLVPAYRLVAMANEMRREANEPIFHVENITQE
ncbi:MAG: hypothetical protein J0G29_01815 [Alphaproteobacteria bacterium]|nr:hypothetical protein [Alphaproteobacteria bacterium]OJV46984.1 MAG: hypothetical protein BGO28_06570 [Alphaproteobacteria bacterium 43-37]